MRRAPIERSAIVVVTGTGLSHEPSRTATYFAAERARNAGTEVLVDLDYRPDQWAGRGLFAAAVQRLLGCASLAVGTEEETVAAADNDNLPEAHSSLGALYVATGKPAQAVAELKRTLELAPNSDEGYRKLGDAYRAAGRANAARAINRRAIEQSCTDGGNPTVREGAPFIVTG